MKHWFCRCEGKAVSADLKVYPMAPLHIHQALTRQIRSPTSHGEMILVCKILICANISSGSEQIRNQFILRQIIGMLLCFMPHSFWCLVELLSLFPRIKGWRTKIFQKTIVFLLFKSLFLRTRHTKCSNGGQTHKIIRNSVLQMYT